MAGFWSRFLGIDSFDAAQRVLPAPYEPFVSTGGIPVADPGTPLQDWIRSTADADHVWRTQPNVRKVIGFAARNVASTPLHVHERISDTERRRVSDHPLAAIVSTPRPRIGAYRFWESVIADGLLYDRWAVLKRIDPDGAMRLSRIPSWRLRFIEDTFGEVDSAWFWNSDEWVELDLETLIFDHGYAPKSAGMTPVATLSDLLDESAEAVQYRRDVWANGARMPQWVSRPEGVQWDERQRERFVTGMRAYVRDGGRAGGVPIFEDGMELHDGTRIPSKDMQDLDGRQITAVEVASMWHISPELVGAREGNFSNVDAYRQMLYRDSLGPYIIAWEQAINVGLTPDLAEGRPMYVEANIEAKLRGSFLEQAKVLQSATGAPWMARNEARALQNRPPIEGADELVTPLNVLIGGQASPRDSGSQNETGQNSAAPSIKARAPETHEAKHREVLTSHFRRQAAAVKSRLGMKADADWWDGDRWDEELAADLYRLALQTTGAVAASTLTGVGMQSDEYDMDRTAAFLTAMTTRIASAINATTKDQLDAALKGEDSTAAVARVFEVAETSRTKQAATTLVTTLSGFASTEAVKQAAGDRGTKTWVVTSKNPRSSHASVDGETVPISENFSNGLAWPGDGNADQAAGCTCELVMDVQGGSA